MYILVSRVAAASCQKPLEEITRIWLTTVGILHIDCRVRMWMYSGTLHAAEEMP